MNDSNRHISGDGRITLVFILLCSLLLVDLVHRHVVWTSKGTPPCQQLYVASLDRLAIEDCREADGQRQQQPIPAQYSPFFYAAIPINSSTKEMLMTVQGIGPVLAEDILQYRRHFGPFTSSADLLKLPGIGPKRAARFAADFSFTRTP